MLSHDQIHNRVVAVKIIDVDAADYRGNVRAKDESIEVTLHEIRVLQDLRDSKAKNVNRFFDAFQMHSQLWIVTEYCPGGSLHTLVSCITYSHSVVPSLLIMCLPDMLFGLYFSK